MLRHEKAYYCVYTHARTDRSLGYYYIIDDNKKESFKKNLDQS